MTFGPRRILVAIAVVLFLLAAFGVDFGASVSFVALGLAAFAAAFIWD